MLKGKKFNAKDGDVQELFIKAYKKAESEQAPLADMILSETGFTPDQANAVYFEVLKKGKVRPQEIEFSPQRSFATGDKGDFSVSAGRIAKLGLSAYFPPNVVLTAKAEGHRIIIEAKKVDGKFVEVEKTERKKTSAVDNGDQQIGLEMEASAPHDPIDLIKMNANVGLEDENESNS